MKKELTIWKVNYNGLDFANHNILRLQTDLKNYIATKIKKTKELEHEFSKAIREIKKCK